jgi:hypothetical protein
MLAATIDGYAQTHFVAHTMRDLSYTWLQARLATAEATCDPHELTAAHETGARLDRRGFMRLIADAEHRVDPSRTLL